MGWIGLGRGYAGVMTGQDMIVLIGSQVQTLAVLVAHISKYTTEQP